MECDKPEYFSTSLPRTHDTLRYVQPVICNLGVMAKGFRDISKQHATHRSDPTLPTSLTQHVAAGHESKCIADAEKTYIHVKVYVYAHEPAT